MRNATQRIAQAVFCLILSIVALQATSSADDSKRAEKEPEHWVPLFDGKSLTGWTPKIRNYDAGDNYGNTFRVEDGLLTVSYDAYDQFDEKFGHLFYKKSFSHYRLRMDYRFIGKQAPGGPGWALRNSGIMVHGQSPDSMTKDQKFPVSIEVQLLGGNGEKPRPTGNLCTPGTNVEMNGKLETKHCFSSKSKTYHGDQWVKVEVEVRGDKVIRHLINGQEVMKYEKPQLDLRDPQAKAIADKHGAALSKGTISLQSESHPVQFRKIEILELPAK